MGTNKIYIWLNQYFAGNISKKDRSKLERWLQESPENKALFEKVKEMWELTGKVTLDLDLDIDQAWYQTQTKIESTAQTKVKPLFHPTIYKVAATILLLALVGAVLFLRNQNDITIYQTIAFETQAITLPDGSQVWLNENSVLSYEGDFSDGQRSLNLSGEAFFEVTKNLQRPFVVHTADLQTTVLGTSFNIKALPADSLSQVAVITGKVGVSLKESSKSMMLLTPGTKASYQKGDKDISRSQNENINLLAWKDKRLVFENTSLAQVVDALEEYYHVSIQIGNSEIAECQLTSSFYDPTLEEVLQVITITMNLEYQKNDATYLLSGQGCKTL